MICRSCGTEIAEKALICYRCGTATTEAKFKPAAPKRGSSSALIASILALAVLTIAVIYLGRIPGNETSRLLSWVAVAAAVIIVALRAYARRK